MSRIYVDFAALEMIGYRCKNVSSKVDIIQSDFKHIIDHLDWDIRFESNIDNTASQIANKLQQYSKILEAYQCFIEEAKNEYIKLDEFKKTNIEDCILTYKPIVIQILGPGGQYNPYHLKDLLESFGSAGSLFGIVNKIFNAKNWIDWSNIGLSITKTISTIAKDYNRYNKIGRAIGTANSTGYFWRNFFGFNKVGHASTANSPSARFYNNLNNTTSPYRLSDAFDAFTGKQGVISTTAAWAGVGLSLVSNAFSNIEEQKSSNGTMSTGRVIAETVSETIIGTVATYAGSAVIGAAIATATGAVAAPVVVAATTGLAIAGINAGCEAVFGVSATEAISDFVLDSASAVGWAVADGAKVVANWFNKISFT